MCLPQSRHFLWWAKMNGIQRRALVNPWRIHCMYSDMTKGTSQAEVVKSQARSLSHCWVMQFWRHQAGRQTVSNLISQLVQNSAKYVLLNFIATFWKHFKSIWKLVWAYFCLTNTALSSPRRFVAEFTLWFARITFFFPTMNYSWSLWLLMANKQFKLGYSYVFRQKH